MRQSFRYLIPVLCCLLLVSACASQPRLWVEKIVREDPPDEVRTVTELFAYGDWLRGMDSSVRVREYRKLDHTLGDACQERQNCLQLALLVGGLEPELADYERARELLRRGLDSDPGPLLSGYIRARLADLEQSEAARNGIRAERREVAALRREVERLTGMAKTLEVENGALKSRIKALETKIEALTSIEQSLKNRGQSE